ncbi:hypothetical protein WICPIJ_008765 [Wickerhamomyces pijperi]|uniref:rRNA adenine N(6)-methyltransferase n=1 Tax=Wickerhamomyces pijperi TaxID=599730 RepID=A0A9P8PVI9_WICPI|nr:hypothetical protein WICPIJ_008765 [Wickerhamomyces pijperi]
MAIKIPIPRGVKLKNYYHASFMKNGDVAVDRLDYKEYGSDLRILDVYSSNLIFSTALHNKLQPAQHILMENRIDYSKHIQQYLPQLPQGHTFEHIPLSPFEWKSYLSITEPQSTILDPGFQSRDHIHSKLLLTGTVNSERLIMQWYACMGNQNWIQRFGNIRMLLWVPEASAIKLLADPGMKTRGKCSIVREAFSDSTLLAVAESSRLNKFPARVLEADSPLLFKESDVSGPKHPLALLEINPKDHSLEDILSWDYVTKNLMILKKKTVGESIKNLGPGSDQFFKQHIPEHLWNKTVSDLTATEFMEITRMFDLWPFKPDFLIDGMIDQID